MDRKATIDQYAAYDLWANTRFVDRLLKEPARVLDQYVKSSFPSLRLTVLHIRDAECAWHARITGQPVRWPAEESTDIGTLIKHATTMRDLVRTLTPDDLLRNVSYKTLKGGPNTQPLLQLLMHCFNHSTYHRGQLVTIMRQLDLDDVPSTDLIGYVRLQEKA
ncbi:MAG: DinB family protein [Flavobacteriales bacterium]